MDDVCRRSSISYVTSRTSPTLFSFQQQTLPSPYFTDSSDLLHSKSRDQFFWIVSRRIVGLWYRLINSSHPSQPPNKKSPFERFSRVVKPPGRSSYTERPLCHFIYRSTFYTLLQRYLYGHETTLAVFWLNSVKIVRGGFRKHLQHGSTDKRIGTRWRNLGF